MKILPGLTTTHDSKWQDKVKEIDPLNLSELALFPTMLEHGERQELYAALEKTGLKAIPHVHARHDFTEKEYKYFVEKWSTKLFNIHFFQYSLDQLQSSVYKDKIYIENAGTLDSRFEQFLKITAGICLDFSHYYDYHILQKRSDYQMMNNLLKKYPVGCCHISAMTNDLVFVGYGGLDNWHYNRHLYSKLTQFDYVKKLKQYLPEVVSLELENSLEQQLKVKQYLEKMLKNNHLGD